MLAYRFAITLIAYVEPWGAPSCSALSPTMRQFPMQSERRGDHAGRVVDDERSHLVIGRVPEEQAVALARTMERRI